MLSQRFSIESYHASGDPNLYCPQAHTCFFSIELPAYTSYEACRDRVLYACRNCSAIDTDFQV